MGGGAAVVVGATVVEVVEVVVDVDVGGDVVVDTGALLVGADEVGGASVASGAVCVELHAARTTATPAAARQTQRALTAARCRRRRW